MAKVRRSRGGFPPPKVTPAVVQRTADEFVRILRKWLTADEFAEMRRRNVQSPRGTCASHDFCDANMAMLEAVQTVLKLPKNQRAAPYLLDDWFVNLWSDAWDKAAPRLRLGKPGRQRPAAVAAMEFPIVYQTDAGTWSRTSRDRTAGSVIEVQRYLRRIGIDPKTRKIERGTATWIARKK